MIIGSFGNVVTIKNKEVIKPKLREGLIEEKSSKQIK